MVKSGAGAAPSANISTVAESVAPNSSVTVRVTVPLTAKDSE